MKIDHPSESSSPAALQRSSAASEHPKAASQGIGHARRLDQDSVSLSAGSGQLQQLSADLTSIQELDSSKIDSIRPKVEAGSYPIDTARLARKIIDLESDLQKP